ncbi:MAG TPA: hypothetical protein PKN57_10290, partial [Saprospiraceae bacterium]|nr:hypothetical protein [Saprospiraceae bacterium]HNO38303.1 hypothetical protein [Saprospiraceae bacterium]
MKNFIKNMALVFTFVAGAAASVWAQNDDLYYDPEKDAVSSQDVYYDDVNNGNKDEASVARQNNNNSRPDGSSDNYKDYSDYDDDDYEYYYSSRIKRFHRPYSGFGYFDDCYVNMYNYDPYWTGATIYIGYDSYSDYFRWRRYQRYHNWSHWGPTYTWGWGYNPWGWNSWNSWGSPWTPWGSYAYSPCPPYGNIYINNVYYGNNWGHGGWYNNGWQGYYDGGHYNEYTSNIHYGPRKTGGGISKLVDNPRGKTGLAIDNPRGVTNQGPTIENPGKVNRNNGTTATPGQTTSRPDRTGNTGQIQSTKNDPIRGQAPQQNTKTEEQVKFNRRDNQQTEEQVKYDRRDNGNTQQNTNPANPRDNQKPVRQDSPVQSPVKDNAPVQKPGRNNSPVQDVKNDTEYKFNSRPSSAADRNTGEGYNNTSRPERGNINVPVERPQRQERVERPQR